MARNFKFSQETLQKSYPYRYILLVSSPFLVLFACISWLFGGMVMFHIGGIFLVLMWMIVCWLMLFGSCFALRLGCALTFCYDPDAPNPVPPIPVGLMPMRVAGPDGQLQTVFVHQPMPGQGQPWAAGQMGQMHVPTSAMTTPSYAVATGQYAGAQGGSRTSAPVKSEPPPYYPMAASKVQPGLNPAYSGQGSSGPSTNPFSPPPAYNEAVDNV